MPYQKSQTLAGSPISQVFMAGYVELAKIKEGKGTRSGRYSDGSH